MINLYYSTMDILFFGWGNKGSSGRVTYSKPPFKLVMEPEFELKQSHTLNHYTLPGEFAWMHTGGFGKRGPPAVAQSCYFPFHLFEVSIYLAYYVISSKWLRTI